MKIIKYKRNNTFDGNGEVVELKILGYMKLKNPKSKLIKFPDKIRIVTEPNKGFSGAATFTIDNKETQIGRIYDKTLNKLLNCKDKEEFTDSNRKKWIKVDEFDFDTDIIYIEV
jgi:hypothetical protein